MEEVHSAELIKSGYFCDTYKGIRLNRHVVAKKLKLFSLTNLEIDSLLRISHGTLVSIYEIVNNIIFMEYVEDITLQDFLYGPNQRKYQVSEALHLMHQAGEGLVFVHSLNPKLAYGRLCTKSIFLIDNFKRLKIGGFPMSTNRYQHILPGEYVAPEIMRGDKAPTQKCDVYSIGIILWELLTRRRPFYDIVSKETELKDYVLQGGRPQLSDIEIFRSELIKELIERCWKSNVSDRPTALQFIVDMLYCFNNTDGSAMAHFVNIDEIDEISITQESLFDYLHNERQKKYSVRDVIHWMHQIALCIHRFPTVHHGYLKPQNIILCNDILHIDMHDYCEYSVEEEINPDKSVIAYIAPEVLDSGTFTKKSDIYSIGILFWEAMARKKPYYHLDNCLPGDIISKIIDGERPALGDLPKSEFKFIEEILQMCWNQDPNERPLMEKLIKILSNPETLDIEFEKYQSEIPPTVHYAEIICHELVGRGTFGKVYRATWRGKQIALKKCEGICSDAEALECFEREKLLSRVNHKNIVKLYGITYNESIPCLLMDFAECKSLQDYLHGRERREYTMVVGIGWMIQCVQGIFYLHTRKPRPLIHRDLKPGNLLLTEDYRTLKIGDFGTATELRTQMTSERGTVSYIAPEVLEGKPYTEKCDIFSFGIILWEVLTRRKPYHHLENPIKEAIMNRSCKGERPEMKFLSQSMDDKLRTLITKCWHDNPDERPTVDKIELHNIPCLHVNIG